MEAPRIVRPPEAVPSRISFAVPGTVVPVPAGADLDHPGLYFNRELSWVDFNWRVLHQAMDARLPLLERVRFLAIAQSNLDEFFRTRVGALQRQLEANVTQPSPDGRLPGEQIGGHPLYAHAAFRRKRQHLADALPPAVRHADLADAPGTERLEDGIEPVDDHGLEAGRTVAE